MVFQKTNEVFINDAHWSVTFVHDIKPFINLISKIKNDLAHVEEILEAITNFYERSNLTGYVETFLKNIRLFQLIKIEVKGQYYQ